MKKKLPVGMSSFKKIIEDDYYYVDKSLFIKEIMDSSGEVVLIPRPRRFGKTLNLSMLKYFLDINGKENNRKLFDNLKINKEKRIMEHFGQYPIIYMSFKDAKSLKYDDAMFFIKEVIANEYRNHNYLLNSEALDEYEKAEFKSIISKEANNVSFVNSLNKLSKYLYAHYNRKVAILVDEYDMAIQSSFVNGYYEEMLEFFRNFLSGGLKDNEYLEKGILTGILKVAKESIFSGLNNLDVSTLLDEQFNNSFGLLKNEVEEIISYYELEFEKEEISKWYNGYNFGGNKVYNPFSIISLVNKKGVLEPYWYYTSSNDVIVNVTRKLSVENKEKIYSLINGEEIEVEIEKDIVYKDVYTRGESIWSFLLFSGYLTWTKMISYDLYNVKIPNEETRKFYKKVITKWFEAHPTMVLKNILKDLTDGKMRVFKPMFKKFAKESLSYYDVTSFEPERFHHAFVLGILISLKQEYEITSNRESGLGRYDISLIPKNKKDHGIIIEFKVAEENENVIDTAKRALKQIKEKEYETKIKSLNLKCLSIGIGFKMKEVEIISEWS